MHAESEEMALCYQRRSYIFASLCLESAAMRAGAEEIVIVEPQSEEEPQENADLDRP